MPLQQERKKAGAVLAKKKKFRYSTSILSDHALIDIADIVRFLCKTQNCFKNYNNEFDTSFDWLTHS